MSPLAIAIVSFGLISATTFLAAYILLKRWPAIEGARLKAPAADPRTSSILRFENEIQSRWQRIAVRLGQALGPGDHARRSQYRRRLVQAGYQDPRAVTIFMGAKVGIALVALCLYPF